MPEVQPHEKLYCPECGIQTVILVEKTDPDPSGEHKWICTCEKCDNLFYIIRGLPGTQLETEDT